MARTQKSTLAADGMGLLQVMPFPAFNPWNWWALAAPRNAALAALHNAHAMVQTYRVCTDCMLAAMREQQDAMAALMEQKLAAKDKAESAPANSDAPDSADNPGAANFVAPMLEATRAYGRLGKAFIVAQRDTMRAITEAGKPN